MDKDLEFAWKCNLEGLKNILGETKIYNIKFKGQDFLLIGSPEEGAIATKEQCENFLPSHAHLDPDGKIVRHCSVIGTKEDIEMLGERKQGRSNG